MRKLSFTAALVAVACAAATLLNACKSPDGAGRVSANADATTAAPGATPHPTSTPNDGVRRMTVEEAQEAVKEGRAVIVDVRGKAEYDRKHIAGSISVPRTEIEDRLSELPKDKLLIFYCA